MNLKKSATVLGAWCLLAFAGFVGAQVLRAALGASDGTPNRVPDHSTVLQQERSRPRFEGDVGGFFIAPRGVSAPQEYSSYDSICGSLPSISVPLGQAGELAISLSLPPEYVLDEASVNTGAVACGDTVYAARYNYVSRTPTATKDAYIIIGRSLFTADEFDVAVDRPRAAVVGGREVVLIEPLTDDGYGQNARAWFPEPFGDTFISATDLSRDEFYELVELVASSTR